MSRITKFSIPNCKGPEAINHMIAKELDICLVRKEMLKSLKSNDPSLEFKFVVSYPDDDELMDAILNNTSATRIDIWAVDHLITEQDTTEFVKHFRKSHKLKDPICVRLYYGKSDPYDIHEVNVLGLDYGYRPKGFYERKRKLFPSNTSPDKWGEIIKREKEKDALR